MPYFWIFSLITFCFNAPNLVKLAYYIDDTDKSKLICWHITRWKLQINSLKFQVVIFQNNRKPAILPHSRGHPHTIYCRSQLSGADMDYCFNFSRFVSNRTKFVIKLLYSVFSLPPLIFASTSAFIRPILTYCSQLLYFLKPSFSFKECKILSPRHLKRRCLTSMYEIRLWPPESHQPAFLEKKNEITPSGSTGIL